MKDKSGQRPSQRQTPPRAPNDVGVDTIQKRHETCDECDFPHGFSSAATEESKAVSHHCDVAKLLSEIARLRPKADAWDAYVRTVGEMSAGVTGRHVSACASAGTAWQTRTACVNEVASDLRDAGATPTGSQIDAINRYFDDVAASQLKRRVTEIPFDGWRERIKTLETRAEEAEARLRRLELRVGYTDQYNYKPFEMPTVYAFSDTCRCESFKVRPGMALERCATCGGVRPLGSEKRAPEPFGPGGAL